MNAIKCTIIKFAQARQMREIRKENLFKLKFYCKCMCVQLAKMYRDFHTRRNFIGKHWLTWRNKRIISSR